MPDDVHCAESTRRVPYATIRPLLRDGDIILFDGACFLSKVIEKCSHGRYSHAGIVAWWGDRAMLLQAELPGVQAVPLSVALGAYDGRTDWWQLKDECRDPAQIAALLAEAKADLGLPFGVLKLLQMGVHTILGTPAPTDDLHGPAPAMFCSEYVGRCFARAGLTLMADEAIASPEAIADSNDFIFRATILSEPALEHGGRRDDDAVRPQAIAGHG